MRITGKLIGKAAGAVSLSLLLAACWGGGDQAGSATASSSSSARIGGAKKAAPVDGSLPVASVCDTFSKDVVSKIIGKTVYGSAQDYFNPDESQPTVCYYYTDKDGIDNVKIQWALKKDALWDDEVNAIGTADPGGTMPTVRVRYYGLGVDAIKETTTYEGDTTVDYAALLKDRGIVVDVINAAGVSDAAQLALTKTVIKTVEKL